METNRKYASFWVRLIAHLIDNGLYFLIFSLTILWSFQATTLQDFAYRLFMTLITVIVPFLVLGLVYSAMFTHLFGATLGKMITGIKVINKEGKYLNKKRSFFRNSIGYQFSGLFFWAGYFNIFRDSERQAWHDKTVGSWVIIKQRLWPLALLVLIILTFTNIYLLTTAVGYLTHGPLKSELSYLYISTQHQIDAKKDQRELKQKLNNVQDATPSTKVKESTRSGDTRN